MLFAVTFFSHFAACLYDVVVQHTNLAFPSEFTHTATNEFQSSQGYTSINYAHTEPFGDQHSAEWIPSPEGQQYLQIPVTQPVEQNGLADLFATFPMPHMAQSVAGTNIDPSTFAVDFLDSWNFPNASTEPLLGEQWISASPDEGLGSPERSMRTMTSDYPDQPHSVELLRDSSQMSSLMSSSSYTNTTDTSFSPPENNLYPNSPHYPDGQLYHEEMDPSSMRRESGYGLRRSSHLSPAFSYAVFHTSPEDVMLTSPVDMNLDPLLLQTNLQPTLDIFNDPWSALGAVNNPPDPELSPPYSSDLTWIPPTIAGGNYTTSPMAQTQRYVPSFPPSAAVTSHLPFS